MATLSVVIVPAKVLKGGRHKIRIAVAHNGETRYIVTDITIDSAKEFKSGSVVRRPDASYLNTKIRGIMQDYQKIIDEIEYAQGLTCSELIFQLKNYHAVKITTLSQVRESMESNRPCSEGTSHAHENFWKALIKVIDPNIKISALTPNHVTKVDNFFLKKGLSGSTISNYMTYLRALINYAIKLGFVEYKINPFMGYKMRKTSVREAWLTVDQVRTIRDFKFKKETTNKCRDLFMLSYYLGGMNIADMMSTNFNGNLEEIEYKRIKTISKMESHPPVRFRVPEEAKEIIKRLIGNDGFIKATNSQYSTRFSGVMHFQLRKIAKATGIDNLIFYSARKSFSQHAFDLGISTTVIDYILGHSVQKGGSCLFHYLRVTPEMATDAIRKVLDNLK